MLRNSVWLARMSSQPLPGIPLVSHLSGDNLQSLAGQICLHDVSPPLFSENVVCGAGSGEVASGLVVILQG